MLPNKVVLLTATLLFSSVAYPLTKSELTCLALSTYHEARSESKADWLKVASVAINRKKEYRYYGARSGDICAIVKSKQYTSAKLLKRKIRDTKSFRAIFVALSHAKLPITQATHFKTRKGVMIYGKN